MHTCGRLLDHLTGQRVKGIYRSNIRPIVQPGSSTSTQDTGPRRASGPMATSPRVQSPAAPAHCRYSQQSVSNMAAISVDDEQLCQATQRRSYVQLREQIAQRAKGRNAVDYYEAGMTPLLSYMFFVLHDHENFVTTQSGPSSHISHFTDRVVFARQKLFAGLQNPQN